MPTLYDNPRYYEIAFSFRDIPKEVDVFEESIARYSKIPAKRFLEVACGNAPHMPVLLERGYEYVGLDLSKEMLDYSVSKVTKPEAPVELLRANLVDFTLDRPADFGYILLGSLYTSGTDELVSHFDSMARAIRPGGLYLLDWCVQFDAITDESMSWDIESEGTKVKTTYAAKMVDIVEQIFEETITIEVDDGGKQGTFVHNCHRRAIYPQEFLFFIEGRDDFEFLGWWYNWDLSRPLVGTERVDRPIILLRRV